MLITEATCISPETPYEYAPGIYTKEQEKEWKKVVDAVHKKGGFICMQLWHLGRAAHGSWSEHPFLKAQNRGLPNVSASAVAVPEGKGVALEWPSMKHVKHTTPRELTKDEIVNRIANDYKLASEAAKRCGFDAVEVHAAHGYLLNQFLCDGVNKRTDEFGPQSIENRTRFLHLVLKSVMQVYPSDRVGVRISPTYTGGPTYYSCDDSNPEDLYPKVCESLNKFIMQWH